MIIDFKKNIRGAYDLYANKKATGVSFFFLFQMALRLRIMPIRLNIKELINQTISVLE